MLGDAPAFSGISVDDVAAAREFYRGVLGLVVLDREGGMLTSVGRLRADHALPNGVKYVLVSHNTKMGAAKGGMLVAEYLVHQGHI